MGNREGKIVIEKEGQEFTPILQIISLIYFLMKRMSRKLSERWKYVGLSTTMLIKS